MILSGLNRNIIISIVPIILTLFSVQSIPNLSFQNDFSLTKQTQSKINLKINLVDVS